VLLLDNSAWARIVAGRLDEERTQEVVAWIEDRSLATCLPFLLEVGYSARSGADHNRIMEDLSAFPRIPLNTRVEQSAQRAQAELAALGHYRLAPIDVMIAACAHEAGARVLHYDADYDILAERTSLSFESVWLAPAGTI
jgi:predicted nucleic acid-binding protein